MDLPKSEEIKDLKATIKSHDLVGIYKGVSAEYTFFFKYIRNIQQIGHMLAHKISQCISKGLFSGHNESKFELHGSKMTIYKKLWDETEAVFTVNILALNPNVRKERD